jgi:CRP/FNR family transcriptional regulator, cyclic AMP receptor protein
MHSLVSVLKEQKIVAGNERLAERIASVAEKLDVPRGTAIIHQGGEDNEVYLIVKGSFDIVVHGRTLARRVAGDHVGEMAAILPVQRRAASVIAHEDSSVLRLSDSQIAELGEEFPQIWRYFATELAHRVEQRNTVASARNERVRFFLMASAPAHPVAHELKRILSGEGLHVDVWEEGAFRGGSYSIENLERKLDESDIAVAIAEHGGGHDSIVFELGFFMGRLGRNRTFLIEPGNEQIELPHELAGINTITYRDGNILQVGSRLVKLAEGLGPNR